MDLVQTVRKEGSRGGRGEFKWDDVKASQHRENYLGHSLMAPVGRWQAGKDLSWYSKGEQHDGEPMSAEDARREELRRIKEAEEDAMAAALGLPVKQRNANLEPLGEKTRVDVGKLVKEGFEEDGDEDMGRAKGFSGFSGRVGAGDDAEVLEGAASRGPVSSRRDGDEKREKRSRSRSRERRSDRRDEGRRRRSRSRSRERERHRHRRHRSRSRSRDKGRRRSRSRELQNRRREREYERHRERERSRSRERRRSRSPRDRHRDRRRH